MDMGWDYGLVWYGLGWNGDVECVMGFFEIFLTLFEWLEGLEVWKLGSWVFGGMGWDGMGRLVRWGNGWV